MKRDGLEKPRTNESEFTNFKQTHIHTTVDVATLGMSGLNFFSDLDKAFCYLG
jgi:hypothetical protein